MFFLDKIFVAGLFLDKIFVAGLLSNQVTVQIKHLCSVPHSLLSHLPVQGRAHLPRAPLSPPTPDVQEGCCLLLILFFFCHVGPTTCLGPVHFQCYNPLSSCPLCMTTLFVHYVINMNSAGLFRLLN